MGRLAIGPDRPRRSLRGAWRWLILAGLGALVLARLFFVELVVVKGNTMAPTILDGDVLLVGRGGEPEVGDVVMIAHEGRTVLRRVIALPGTLVGADEGVLTLGAVPLETRVAGSFAYQDTEADRPLRQQHFVETLPDGRRHEVLGDHVGAARPWLFEVPVLEIPPGHLFVLCDNRRTCPVDALSGVVPMAWSQGVARAILWYGEARLAPPEERPIYGAFEWINSRSESSGRK